MCWTLCKVLGMPALRKSHSMRGDRMSCFDLCGYLCDRLGEVLGSVTACDKIGQKVVLYEEIIFEPKTGI